MVTALFLASWGSVWADAPDETRPKAKYLIDVTVEANVFLGNVSTCVPGDRDCVMVVYPPAPVTPLTTAIYSGTLHTYGLEYYFPFTPCVFELPPHREKVVPLLEVPATRVSPNWPSDLTAKVVPFVYRNPNLPKECEAWQRVYPEIVRLWNERRQEWEERAIRPILDYMIEVVHSSYASAVPIKRITAGFGYSVEYFQGTRFHEGLDTSWNTPACSGVPCNFIYAPVAIMPVAVYGGWALGMAPCDQSNPDLLEDGFKGARALLEGIHKIESGEADCAILWGGFHVVSEDPLSVTGVAARLMNQPEARGKLPLEVSPELYTPAGHLFVPCALVSGYAGNYAPHCHYQAAIIPGGLARLILRGIRENPASYFRSPSWLVTHPTDWDTALRWRDVYRYAVDPMLFLFPDIFPTTLELNAWTAPRMPSGVSYEYTPFGWWFDERHSEYLPAMPLASEDAVIENQGGDECRLKDKALPGYYCKPAMDTLYNIFNATEKAKSRDKGKSALERIWDVYISIRNRH